MSTTTQDTHPRGAWPLPWRGLVLGGAATGVICFALMLWVDEPLAASMYALRDTPLVAIFRVVTLLANSAIWYVFALVGMAYAWWLARRDPIGHGGGLLRQRLRAGVFLIVSMLASGLLINGLKLLLGRDRPLAFMRDGGDVFHGPGRPLSASSFPSGHSQSIWAAMVAISWIYPPARPLCVIVAILVSASRIIIDMHFASDVVAGMYFALVTAAIFRVVFEQTGPALQLTASNDPSRSAA